MLAEEAVTPHTGAAGASAFRLKNPTSAGKEIKLPASLVEGLSPDAQEAIKSAVNRGMKVSQGEQIAYLAYHMNSSKKFRDTLEARYDSIPEERRVLVDLAKTLTISPEDFKQESGLLGRAVNWAFKGQDALIQLMPDDAPASSFVRAGQQQQVSEVELGPDKNYKISAFVSSDNGLTINARQVRSELENLYYTDALKKGLIQSEADKEKYKQEASDLAVKDIARAARSGRNIMFAPEVSKTRVEDYAKFPFPLSGMAAYLSPQRVAINPWAPTTEELSKEGKLDQAVRLSPFDMASAPLRWWREHIEMNITGTGEYPDALLATLSNENILQSAGRVMGELYDKSEKDIIYNVFDQTTLMEELAQWVGATTEFTSLIFGASAETAEGNREAVSNSFPVRFATFLPYLVEPDVFTVATGGLGYAAAKGARLQRVRKAYAISDILEEASKKDNVREAFDFIAQSDKAAHLLAERKVFADMGLNKDQLAALEVDDEKLEALTLTSDATLAEITDLDERIFSDPNVQALITKYGDNVEGFIEDLRTIDNASYKALTIKNKAEALTKAADARLQEAKNMEGEYTRLHNEFDSGIKQLEKYGAAYPELQALSLITTGADNLKMKTDIAKTKAQAKAKEVEIKELKKRLKTHPEETATIEDQIKMARAEKKSLNRLIKIKTQALGAMVDGPNAALIKILNEKAKTDSAFGLVWKQYLALNKKLSIGEEGSISQQFLGLLADGYTPTAVAEIQLKYDEAHNALSAATSSLQKQYSAFSNVMFAYHKSVGPDAVAKAGEAFGAEAAKKRLTELRSLIRKETDETAKAKLVDEKKKLESEQRLYSLLSLKKKPEYGTADAKKSMRSDINTYNKLLTKRAKQQKKLQAISDKERWRSILGDLSGLIKTGAKKIEDRKTAIKYLTNRVGIPEMDALEISPFLFGFGDKVPFSVFTKRVEETFTRELIDETLTKSFLGSYSDEQKQIIIDAFGLNKGDDIPTPEVPPTAGPKDAPETDGSGTAPTPAPAPEPTPQPPAPAPPVAPKPAPKPQPTPEPAPTPKPIEPPAEPAPEPKPEPKPEPPTLSEEELLGTLESSDLSFIDKTLSDYSTQVLYTNLREKDGIAYVPDAIETRNIIAEHTSDVHTALAEKYSGVKLTAAKLYADKEIAKISIKPGSGKSGYGFLDDSEKAGKLLLKELGFEGRELAEGITGENLINVLAGKIAPGRLYLMQQCLERGYFKNTTVDISSSRDALNAGGFWSFGPYTMGQASRGRNKIAVITKRPYSQDFVNTICHELLHIATLNQIQNGINELTSQGMVKMRGGRPLRLPNFTKAKTIKDPKIKAIVDLYALEAQVRKAFKTSDLSSIGPYDKQRAKRYSEEKTPIEIASWAFNEPKFMQWLSTVQLKGENKSALTSFVETILRLLGFKPSSTDALTELTRITENILDVGRKDAGSGTKTVRPEDVGITASMKPADAKARLRELIDTKDPGNVQQAVELAQTLGIKFDGEKVPSYVLAEGKTLPEYLKLAEDLNLTVKNEFGNLPAFSSQSKIDFTDADLGSVEFPRGLNLRGVSFSNANLRDSVLEGLDLRGVDFSTSEIGWNSFAKSDLRGANLDFGPVPNNVSWRGAKYNDSTKFPKGFDPVAEGMIKVDDDVASSIKAPETDTPTPEPEPEGRFENVTGAQTDAIRQALSTLEQAKLKANGEDLDYRLALFTLTTEWDVAVGSKAKLKRYFRTVANKFIDQGQGNITSRFGKTNLRMSRVLKGTENIINKTTEEAIQLTEKIYAESSEAISGLYQYLDSTVPQPLKNGFTMMNNVQGLTVFEAAKKAILADSRVIEVLNKKKSKAKIKGKNKTADVVDIIEEGTLPASLIGLSRMWMRQSSDKLAGELAVKAARLLTSPDVKTFKDFQEKMKALTKDVLGEENVDTRTARCIGLGAKSVIHGSGMFSMTNAIRRELGSVLSTDEAKDINVFMQGIGSVSKPQETRDFFAAMDNMVNFGLTLAGRQIEAGSVFNVKQRSRDLLNIGKGTYIPSAAVQEIDGSLSKQIKKLEAVYTSTANEVAAKSLQAVMSALRLTKTGMTTGLLLPKPQYFTFAAMSDLAQIWFVEGPKTAAKTAIPGLLGYMPFGRDLVDRLSRTMGEKGAEYARSTTDFLFDPHVSRFWDINTVDDAVMDIAGKKYVVGDLRRIATESGVMDTFIHENLAEVLRELKLRQEETAWYKKLARSGLDTAKTVQGYTDDFAMATQQRMRTVLWFQKMNEGMSPERAARAVDDSLYDWSHGVNRNALLSLAQTFPFYRYWNLALQQGMKQTLKPITATSFREVADMALKGETGQARLKQLSYFYENVLADSGTEPKTEEEALAQAFVPGWARGARATTTPRRLSQEERIELSKGWDGKFADPGALEKEYMFGILPALGPLDSYEMLLVPLKWGITMTLLAAGEDKVAEDWMVKSLEPITSNLYPLGRGFADKLMDDWFRKDLPNNSPNVPIKPSEAKVLQTISALNVAGAGFEPPVYDEEKKRWMASKMGITTLRMIPVIGSQIPKLLDDLKFKNPYNKRQVAEYTRHALLNIFGIVKTYNYSHERERDRSLDDFKFYLDQRKKEISGVK
jgi:hypothetical protein